MPLPLLYPLPLPPNKVLVFHDKNYGYDNYGSSEQGKSHRVIDFNQNNNACSTGSCSRGGGLGNLNLSEETKRILHKPMSQWWFGDTSDTAKRTETGSRVAGQEVQIGQVPKSTQARIQDMRQMNAYIRQVLEMAKQMGLVPSNTPVPRELVPGDVRTIMAEFYLAPDGNCTKISPDLSTLLPPPHLAHISRRTMQDPPISALDSDQEVRSVGGANGKRAGQNGTVSTRKRWPTDHFINSLAPKCATIARAQEDRKIYLRVYDLLTSFPERWLDSVIIDAYIHLLLEHSNTKDMLYVNSAEHDPSLAEIKNTPSCYKYIVIPLWLASHWTILLISHSPAVVNGKSYRGRIRYLNSQVVDRRTPEMQTRPFKELFPDYHVALIAKPDQCNSFDCGVYVCLWATLFLFYDEEEIDRIKCPDAEAMRMTILQQLILSYIVLKRSFY
jgi:hypothetical protein